MEQPFGGAIILLEADFPQTLRVSLDETTTYKSIDAVINQDEALNYISEFLNLHDLARLPSHIINLKIGMYSVILLRHKLSFSVFLEILLHPIFELVP
ncbi:hypothetical protein CEXT_640821 [Caerostris extrusa]|uniref:DNA helicase n=1 Tax=Caerostris extrusa TaxID=172846 RepID=A0AAV4MWU5_CAEEX|nr:hypothetical protein CEXT_640821 [Caerostris extrusa]